MIRSALLAALMGTMITSTSASGSPRSEASYAWATSQERIGTNPAYLEKVLGPAERKYNGSWTFEINGCEVEFSFEGSSIKSLSADIGPSCSVIVNGKSITSTTTFGQIGRTPNAELVSHCIGGGCGNAADPTINLYIRGYRANGFVDAMFWGKYGDGQSRAMDIWATSIRRDHGIKEADEDGSLLNCISKAPSKVAAAMSNERFVRVTIGTDLNRNCEHNQE